MFGNFVEAATHNTLPTDDLLQVHFRPLSACPGHPRAGAGSIASRHDQIARALYRATPHGATAADGHSPAGSHATGISMEIDEAWVARQAAVEMMPTMRIQLWFVGDSGFGTLAPDFVGCETQEDI